MNLSHAHTPTLTARLLGDPDPARFVRSDRLRRARAADFRPPATPAQRRDMVLVALKEGPMTTQQLADETGLVAHSLRHDLTVMVVSGLLERSGGRRGVKASVLWRLRGAPAPDAPVERRSSTEIRMERIVNLLQATDQSLTCQQINAAIGGCRSKTTATLKIARERGLITVTDPGRVGSSPIYRLSLVEGA